MIEQWSEEVLEIVEKEVFKYYKIFGYGGIQKIVKLLIEENQNEIKQYKFLNAINNKNDNNLFFAWQNQVSFLISKELAQKIIIVKTLENKI